jgi:excisionase family DNA binding protein
MPTRAYLTVAELAAVTKIARSTWYQWIHEGRVPHIKIGDCVRFDEAEVNAWLRQHAKPGRLQRVPAVEV